MMENDTWETQEWMKTEIRLTCGSLAKTSELIRSLRDDEQVKSSLSLLQRELSVKFISLRESAGKLAAVCKNVKLILLTPAFVNFKDKLIPTVWKWIT